MTRHLPTTSSQATHNQSSSYTQPQRPIWCTTRIDLYFEETTLSKFIHEGRPTTTKPTFVALPSLTSHSIFYECSRGILCQPQDSPQSPLTRLGVTISYSLHLERKITLPSTSIISPYVYSEPSDEPIRHLYAVPSVEKFIRDH